MPRRGILILSGAPRIVSSVSDLENPAAQAPPSVYLKTRPAHHCPIKPQLAAIQRRRCGPIWPRHNGPVSAAANKLDYKGLGFSKQDRDENIRRIGFVCQLLTRNCVIAIVAAISPYRAAREEVRKRVGSFVEVYVKCPLEICMRRDAKGMYAQAVSGLLSNFTGVSDPYEEPSSPELVLYTDKESAQESARKVLEELSHRKYIAPDRPPFESADGPAGPSA